MRCSLALDDFVVGGMPGLALGRDFAPLGSQSFPVTCDMPGLSQKVVCPQCDSVSFASDYDPDFDPAPLAWTAGAVPLLRKWRLH